MMFLTYFLMDQDHHTKNIKIWGVRVYIINRHIKRKNLDDISHSGYFMGYETTKGVVIYWKPDQDFDIHRAHTFLV